MDPKCICDNDNYKSGCPYTFEQGGSRFHCLGGDLHAVPAISDDDSDDSWDSDNGNTGMDGLIDMLSQHNVKVSEHINNQNINPIEYDQQRLVNMEKELKNIPRNFIVPQNLPKLSTGQTHDPKMNDSGNDFLLKNRTTLQKFEALQLNGKSINDYTIGGFRLDLKATAKKVNEIAPLPPNALPKIFIDDNLNFYHHFFKGMEILLGGSKFQEIVDSKIHHEATIEDLPSSVIGFMEAGMCVGDSALTLLVKKVLSSTFEKSVLSDENGQISVLKVASNLWGFRYIEPGMVLQDADIKMWLSNCYSFYRTIWFDTFKSSGVPMFAIEGVIINTAKPVLKMTKSIDVDDRYRRSSPKSSDDQLVRYEGRDRKKYNRRPSHNRGWFN